MPGSGAFDVSTSLGDSVFEDVDWRPPQGEPADLRSVDELLSGQLALEKPLSSSATVPTIPVLDLKDDQPYQLPKIGDMVDWASDSRQMAINYGAGPFVVEKIVRDERYGYLVYLSKDVDMVEGGRTRAVTMVFSHLADHGFRFGASESGWHEARPGELHEHAHFAPNVDDCFCSLYFRKIP